MTRLSKIGIFVVLMSLLTISQSFAAVYTIDNVHSQMGFAVKHLMVSTVRGDFRDYTGQLEFDPNNLNNFTADVTIQTQSINTNNQDRDNHLRSADFLDAVKYPTITFKSKEIHAATSGYEIVGDLTIHGVTKQITLPVTINGPVKNPLGGGEEVIGLTGETVINRQDFGVSWNKTMDQGGMVLDDNVRIVVELEAHQAK